ncbi:MAG: CoA pyrophosphatase [Acidobacteriota bacterium]
MFEPGYIRERLRRPKPGLTSQLKMVPDPRPGHKTYLEAEGSCLRAAVLVLLYPRRNRLHLVLTRRTSGVAQHQAQISFPGGQKDENESIIETAIREAHEELGIRRESIEIIEQLTPLYVPPSNYCIYPVVAFALQRPGFLPSSREVAEIIEVPVDHLMNAKNVRREVWQIRGADVSVPFYVFRGHKVWGATAMVLAELLDLIR